MEDNTKYNFDTAKIKFNDWYHNNYDLLKDSAKKYLRTTKDIISKEENITEPKIVYRIKEKNGCVDKFKRNYLEEADSSGEKYLIQDYITDIIGIRIICFYESEIDMIYSIIKEEFDILEKTDKTKILEEDDDRVRYKGLHLDICFSERRRALHEYITASQFNAEIQIKTIVQDAWSEIDHKLKYKKDLPVNLRRRINILSGLFELVDSEFEGIKRDREEYIKKAIRKKYTDRDILSPFSMLDTMKKYFPRYPFDELKIEGFCNEIREIKPDITNGEFMKAMDQHFDRVKEYREYNLNEFGRNLNPYTMVRHILFRYRPAIFESLLIERFRNNFNRWDVEGYIFPPTN